MDLETIKEVVSDARTLVSQHGRGWERAPIGYHLIYKDPRLRISICGQSLSMIVPFGLGFPRTRSGPRCWFGHLMRPPSRKFPACSCLARGPDMSSISPAASAASYWSGGSLAGMTAKPRRCSPRRDGSISKECAPSRQMKFICRRTAVGGRRPAGGVGVRASTVAAVAEGEV
jgi:hypothetical protein